MSKTRLLKIGVATLIVVLIVSVVYLVKHQSNPNLQEEQEFPPLAPLEVGDSWTLALTINETEYNLTITVTDEEVVVGQACYKMKLIFKPESPFAKLGMFNEMTAWLDKSTLQIMKLKGKGRYKGYDFRYVEEHSYTFHGGYPSLTVGNEYSQTDNKTIDIDYKLGFLWHDYSDEKSTTKTWVKVEALENVTVPAGTFSCYKIVTYDETGQNTLSTMWFSMEAKTAVKSENYETGETTELISYSISI